MPIKIKSGFTLAEVLIALALLGIIAAFTIPKILNNSGNTSRNALFKESIALLSDLTYQAKLNNIAATDVPTFYLSRMNALKTCPNSAELDGCATVVPGGQDSDEPGVLLPNGVAIFGFSACCDNTNSWTGKANTVVIDYNGSKGPDTLGEDRLFMDICFGDSPCTSAILQPTGMPSGSANASFLSPQNRTFYLDILK